MIFYKLTPIALSAALLVSSAMIPPAFADGMPYGAKPQPVLVPLDEALDEIQNKEVPVDVTQPAPIEEVAPPPEAAVAVAEPEPAPAPVPESRVVEVQNDSSFFGLSVGIYDPFTHGMKEAAFNFEWQPGVKIAGTLQPLFGAFITTQGSKMGYGGIGVPFKLGERVFVMPSVAAGAYGKGDGYDLDRTLAFRVGTELAYEFDDKSRIGINAHVLTNGTSFHRSDRTEIISLVYTMPLDIFSGKDRSSSLAPAETTNAADKAMSEGSSDEPPVQNTTNQ